MSKIISKKGENMIGEKEQRIKTILEIKEIMKHLANINLEISEMNRNWINDANDNLKTLCELLNY